MYYIENSLGKISEMKRLIFLLPLLLSANEDFISHYEYGEMLYNNPRGVSCAQCHGKQGEGKVIVKYREENEEKVIKGSDIRRKPLSQMIHTLNSFHKIMPRYYLTDKEAKAIYDYIQKKNEFYLSQTKENSTAN